MNSNVIEIALTNGEPFRVRQLGLFELDNIIPDSLGPFTYKMEIFGKEYDVEFDISAYDEPPKKPEKSPSEIKPGTIEEDQLLDWQLYSAAKTHIQKRIDRTNEFYLRIKNYIIHEACLDDPNALVNIEDWRRVYDAALVPQLTIEIIAKTLDNSYSAKFNGMNVLEALQTTKKGRGSYDTIKLWENKLMISMNKTEMEYTMLPLEERARKVCAMFLSEIMSFLEMDYESKLSENKIKT